MNSANRHTYELLAKARERFQRGEPLGRRHPVREIILRSWERCREAGLDPGSVAGHIVPRDLFEQLRKINAPLLETAVPAIDIFYNSIQDSQTNMLLTDAQGIVLYSKGEGTGFDDRPACAACGFDGSEACDGTTSIGLCLREKRTVYATGAEHYKHIFDNWHCTSAPILDPSDNLIGTVSFIINRKDLHLHTLGMAAAAAGLISEQLKLRLLLQNHRTILDLLNEAVIVLDGQNRIKEINPYACKLFRTTAKAIGQSVAAILKDEDSIVHFRDPAPVSDQDVTFTLAGGTQLHCSLSASRTEDGGIIINLREHKRMRHFAKRFMGMTTAKFTFEDILGESVPMRQAKRLALAASPNDASVLILGESGVGKELFAQAIHNNSPRRNGPFIAINCGAIPRDLVQSELFGYEPGAFTGASREGMLGKFEMADGGTLFLDEIGDMALNVQVNLLRVLQEGTVTRVGGKVARSVDVRVIAATHRNLAAAVETGAFRGDLYYRLNVFSLVIPPLRERVTDIALLVRFFLGKYQAAGQKKLLGFAPEVLECLESYSWPGNVRELENVIERATIVGRHSIIQKEDLPLDLLARIPAVGKKPQAAPACRTSPPPAPAQDRSPEGGSEGGALREQEAGLILNTLAATKGNMRATAKILGVSRGTLYSRLKRYGIDPENLRR